MGIECLFSCGRRGRSQFEAFRVADGNVVQQDGREIGEQGKESCERPSRPARFCSRLLLGPEGDGLAGSTGEARCARAACGSSSSNRIGASLFLICHSAWQANMNRKTWARAGF